MEKERKVNLGKRLLRFKNSKIMKILEILNGIKMENLKIMNF